MVFAASDKPGKFIRIHEYTPLTSFYHWSSMISIQIIMVLTSIAASGGIITTIFSAFNNKDACAAANRRKADNRRSELRMAREQFKKEIEVAKTDSIITKTDSIITFPLCQRCGSHAQKDRTICLVCAAQAEHTRTGITDFDAFMACPWCGAEDWHFMREAHPQPTQLAREIDQNMHEMFLYQQQHLDCLGENYERWRIDNAENVVYAFGHENPVRVYMNAAATAAAGKIKPPNYLAVDTGPMSKYDPVGAVVIRECTTCKKEWAQK
jgi:hypothetical protein